MYVKPLWQVVPLSAKILIKPIWPPLVLLAIDLGLNVLIYLGLYVPRTPLGLPFRWSWKWKSVAALPNFAFVEPSIQEAVDDVPHVEIE